MKKIFLVGAFAAFMVSACNKDDDNKTNSTDQNFMTQVAIGNKAEIMAGQLAATKGTNAQVIAFGQMMMTEHGQAQTDLAAVANSVGWTLPDTVDAEHQALMVRLNSLSGHSFDTAYINSQVRDHQKTLTIFQSEINGGNNQSVRNYANQYLPHIQMHLQRADSISRNL
jgi:putative membrane protein